MILYRVDSLDDNNFPRSGWTKGTSYHTLDNAHEAALLKQEFWEGEVRVRVVKVTTEEIEFDDL
jgi:hypothetical protein